MDAEKYSKKLERPKKDPEKRASIIEALAAKKEPEDKSALVNEAQRRMLIVDDNEMNRKLLTGIFRDEYTIETANDGREAMIKLRRYGTGISIVLLDLLMPGMDGFAVLEKMRESVEMQTIPVVVVSGANDRENSLKSIRCGASDFVNKPVDPDVIRIRVHSAVSKADNERLRAQNSYLQLQSSQEAKYRIVLESTGTVVIELDWINNVFTYDQSITNYIAGNYDKRKLWQILLSDRVADSMDVKAMQEFIYKVADDRLRKDGTMNVILRTPAREKHWFRLNIFKHSDDFGLTDKLTLTFNDINDEIIADEKLRYQVERDDLTGLYNRRTFLRKAEEMVRAKPANTYFMSVGDIDRFKVVNDRFGHEEGDRLLQYAAEKIQADADNINGLCGRLGNDVFATLFPHDFTSVEKINYHPRDLLAHYPLNMELTCSFGHYLIDDPEMPADGMLDRASIAKETVKGRYETKLAWYDESMREKLLAEQEITGSMEEALANGQFDIYLQPQYNHATGNIMGAEALARWLHPEKGVIAPAGFIPVFEKNGFIVKLDEYVWNRAAELLHSWISQGQEPIPISVNVSRQDIDDPAICEKLLKIVHRHNIPINLFRLEITESLFINDSERLIALVDKLHKAGFTIEMDDFGSGYSSLNILKDMAVDILKLDMRFFSNSAGNDRGGVIVNSVVRMTRWLNIPVVAEGVEKKEQADFLLSIGCRSIQGYLYAKPMPVHAFNALLSQSGSEPDDRTKMVNFLDTEAFWDPRSTDSQFFLNYMPAAIVYEYNNGNFEALRLNRRLSEMLKFNAGIELPRNGLVVLHKDDVPALQATTERAIASGKDETVEIRRVFADKPDVIWLRATLQMMAKGPERALILCTLEDVTQQKG